MSHCEAETPTAATTPSSKRVLLVGRPNSGKSTLFNLLTGRSAKIGNFPGVTVDVMEGQAVDRGLTVVDLPGLYSIQTALDPDSDEGIASRVIADEPSSTPIVQIVDATSLALGLKLTAELLPLERPLLVVVTQCDMLASAGLRLDPQVLEDALGAKVLAVSGREARASEQVLAAIEGLDSAPRTPRPLTESAQSLAKRALSNSDLAQLRRRTETLDRLFLHPVLGPILFLSLTTLAFAAVFLIADPATEVIEGAMNWLADQAGAVLGDNWFSDFLRDGVLAGAGTVLIFMPQIVILTVVMELLEASGYLARGAFLLDRVLRALGLSGRAFMPMLMSHACAVPAIGATRIVRDPRERLTTLLVLPLLACSARLPTYGLLLTAFFSHKSVLFRAGMFVFLYFAGIISSGVAAWVISRRVVRAKSLPLVLEMPMYRLPQRSVVLRQAWRTSKRFLREVGTNIVIVSAALYVLLNLSVREPAHEDEPLIERSVAASVGKALEPVTAPAGFDWRINIGLIGSFGAREVMVGTMGIIMGIEDADSDDGPLAEKLREATREDGTPLYGTATAAALLAFFVLACQCMSTVAALRRETKSWRWPAFVLAYTYAAAYLAAVLTYQLVTWFA